MTKKLPILKQFSNDFQIPMAGVYLVILVIISLAGVFASTSALKQEQKFDISAQTYQIVDCNESCDHNHQCAANHFCFQSRCRLASNPQSPSCQSIEAEKSTLVNPTTIPISPTQPSQQKGDDVLLPTVSIKTENPQELAETATQAADINTTVENDTATTAAQPEPTTTSPNLKINQDTPLAAGLAIIQKTINWLIQKVFVQDNMSLPIIFGVGLIGLILLITIVSKINSKKIKVKYLPTDFNSLEKQVNPAQTSKQPQLSQPPTDQIKTTQQNEIIPTGPTRETDLPQPKFSDEQNEDLTPPPSSMISRIKEKDVDMP